MVPELSPRCPQSQIFSHLLGVWGGFLGAAPSSRESSPPPPRNAPSPASLATGASGTGTRRGSAPSPLFRHHLHLAPLAGLVFFFFPLPAAPSPPWDLLHMTRARRQPRHPPGRATSPRSSPQPPPPIKGASGAAPTLPSVFRSPGPQRCFQPLLIYSRARRGGGQLPEPPLSSVYRNLSTGRTGDRPLLYRPPARALFYDFSLPVSSSFVQNTPTPPPALWSP